MLRKTLSSTVCCNQQVALSIQQYLRVCNVLLGNNGTCGVCAHVSSILSQEGKAILQQVRRMECCADLNLSHLLLAIGG